MCIFENLKNALNINSKSITESIAKDTLVKDLTDEQLELIYKSGRNNWILLYRFDWMIKCRARYMCEHYPKYMAENHPNLALKYHFTSLCTYNINWVIENAAFVLCDKDKNLALKYVPFILAKKDPQWCWDNDKSVLIKHNLAWLRKNQKDYIAQNIPELYFKEGNYEYLYYYNFEYLKEHNLKWIEDNYPESLVDINELYENNFDRIDKLLDCNKSIPLSIYNLFKENKENED